MSPSTPPPPSARTESGTDTGIDAPPVDRLKTFVASDRLLRRAWRVVAARPYVTGSIVLHAAVVGLLLQLPGWGVAEQQRADAAQAVRADHEVATTEARELQRRVDRMEAIRREMDGDDRPDGGTGSASAPEAAPSAPTSPEALAARARALSEQIDAADRRRRAERLAQLTAMSPAEARRKIDAEAAAKPAAAKASAPADLIASLERRARETVEAKRTQAAAQANGVGVTLPTRAEIAAANAVAASASKTPASGSTGQQRPADGNLRSAADQLASMIRSGEKQGRVGVEGSASGRSVNREGVKGVEGGRVVAENDNGPKDLSKDVPLNFPVNARGASIDLTRGAVKGSHDLVHYADAPAVDAATVRTGAGRTFGAGGTFATRVYLDSWYVIGPFEGHGEGSLATVYPPEEDVDLDGAYRGQDGKVVTWKYASRGFYPFIPPGVTDNAVYYATTELRVDDDRDVWLSIAADDDSMMWLDGRLVWVGALGDKPWLHFPYFFRDEDVASLSLAEGQRRVHLARGTHRLLFKLFNDTDRAFFSVVVAS